MNINITDEHLKAEKARLLSLATELETDQEIRQTILANFTLEELEQTIKDIKRDAALLP